MMFFRCVSIPYLFTLALVFNLQGCSTLGYYAHMAKGHFDVLGKREPIGDILSEESTPPDISQKLRLVLESRRFAEQELQLDPDGHYLHYVDLGRPYVVWNVFAAPELSVKPKKWCYPVAGCTAYRGYYSEQEAKDYSATLVEEGYDIYVGGVAAYSTLGWFDDPVLSTFMRRSQAQLASLIFHELAHQKLYVKGDSTFNESFATVIAREGLRRWVENKGKPKIYQNFVQRQGRHTEFAKLVIAHRRKLHKMYSSDLPEEEKRKGKQQIITDLRSAYQKVKKEQWSGYNGYDKWFSDDINNAKLVTVSTYHAYVPKLEKKLELLNRDLTEFYQWCEKIGKLSYKQRRKLLR